MDQSSRAEPTQTPEEAEAAYEKFVWDNLKRNYIGNYLHGMLGMTGFRLVNAPTFLPAYLHTLAGAVPGADAIVGLGLALQQAGGILSPIFGATQIEHRKKLLPVAQWVGMGMRIPILGIALVGWFLPPHIQLPIIVALLFMMGAFSGMQRVAFQTLLAKVIPVSLRGRLQAWRNVTGGVIAATLAYFAGKLLIEKNVLGNGYSTTFLLAFVLTSLGLSALAILLRAPIPPTVRPRVQFKERIKDFPALLKEDVGFRNYTILIVLAATARMAMPFYILYAGKTIHLSGANVGLLSLAFLGADTVSNIAWGYLGDKAGFRAVTMGALAIWIAATALLMNSTAMVPIFIAFVGLGASGAGYQMASSTMVLEFGTREEMPMRLALTGTAEQAMGALGPLLGGVIATVLGYQALFTVSIVFLVAALALLYFRIEEPRNRRLAREAVQAVEAGGQPLEQEELPAEAPPRTRLTSLLREIGHEAADGVKLSNAELADALEEILERMERERVPKKE